MASDQPIGPVVALAYGIEEQLVGIEAMAPRRIVRAVHAVAINLAGAYLRQVDVPDLVGLLPHRDSRHLRRSVGVLEEAEFHGRGVFAENREVDAAAVPCGAQGVRVAGVDLVVSEADFLADPHDP